MTETEGAEVAELAELLWRADRDASASAIGFAAMFRDDSCQFAYRAQARAILTSDWLAARETAAEARGANSERARHYVREQQLLDDNGDAYWRGHKDGAARVLAAVEAAAPRMYTPLSIWAKAVAAARAAAMTVSSEKSSSLATRVPQDESQHGGGS